MEHIESETRIYFTKEYGRFKFLKGNRDINERKVEKIIDSIHEGVDILRYAPVIVNENMEIIDGQHRFAVSQQLKANVYYVIHKSADLSIVPAINSKSSKWRTVDFLNSYLDLKKEQYEILYDFITNKFDRLNLPTAIKLLYSGGTHDNGAMEAFRDGLYDVRHLDEATQICKLLKDFEPHTDNPFSGRFIEVATKLLKSEKYNHSLMIEKLNQSGRRIERIQSAKSIIEDMESIINHRLKEPVTII
jgi:hypothetical protein